VDQGPYTPPPTVPNQDPPPPPPPTATPPGYGTPVQPPKSKKTLIIILIIVALLLCLCTAGGSILAIAYFADQEAEEALQELETTLDDLEIELDTELDDTTMTPLDEWYVWSPTVDELKFDSPTPWQQAVAEGIMADLYPEFTLLDTYVSVGGWDEAAETYYMDFYNVRAYLADDSNVMIGEYFWASSRETTEDDELVTAEDLVDEGEAFGVLDDGTEYIFPLSKTSMNYALTAELQELLTTVTEEWPGALITYVEYINGDESMVDISFTTWDHYCTTSDFEGVAATYLLQSGQWLLDSYQWVLPEL